MSKENVTSAYYETTIIGFVKDAMQEGAHKKLPQTQGMSENKWAREKNIGAVYIGSPAVLQTLADQYGVTRERIRQINDDFLKDLWTNCSDETRTRHPLKEILSLSKPADPKGLIARIEKTVMETGITDPERIASKLNIPSKEVARRRGSLKRRGFNISFTLTPYEKLVKAVEREKNDDKKLQAILDSYTATNLIGFLNRHRKDEERILVSLSSVLEKGEFHFAARSIKDFAEKVKTEGIPIISCDSNYLIENKYKQRFFIVFSRHARKIIKALGNDPDLQKFKKD